MDNVQDGLLSCADVIIVSGRGCHTNIESTFSSSFICIERNDMFVLTLVNLPTITENIDVNKDFILPIQHLDAT